MSYHWILLFLLAIIWPDGPAPDSGWWEPAITDYPAVVTVYDPALGGINCDADCSTVATGPLEPWMYEMAGACDVSLLGRTVYFPLIDLEMYCADTGTLVEPAWSDHHGQTVLYFDVLWHLERSGNRILGAPEWNYWLLEDWTIIH